MDSVLKLMSEQASGPLRAGGVLLGILLLAALKSLRANVSGVEICDRRDGIYYAALNIRMADKAIRLDCRPSDAVALALRAGVPILVRASLFADAAGSGAAAARASQADQPQRPDAAADMARQATARREADSLAGMLQRGSRLPHADPDLERVRARAELQPGDRAL